MYGYINHVRKNNDKVDIVINGNPRTNYSRTTSYKMFQIADQENSKFSTVEATGNISNKDELEGVFYYLDLKELQSAVDNLKKNTFQTENCTDGKLVGTYLASEDDENLMLTIPYDKGWKIKCNGKSINADSERTFTVLKMKKGVNEIEMTYVSPGIYEGILISLLGILLFAIWQKAEMKFRRLKDV